MVTCNKGIKPKNKHLQSFLASSKIRLLRLLLKNTIKLKSEKKQLKLKSANLAGIVTQREKASRLYILLHGWEGSTQSTYIQLLANQLYQQKKATIFRLNFRDHGDTHHLNKGLFHSCRLEEVCEAVKKITELYPHKKVILCGFSLGGNFALRIAANAERYAIKLTKVFAISPPINPKNSMLAIERSPLYSKYFLRKWQKSLVKKNKYHPENFDNNQYQQIKSLDKLTEVLILKNTDYNSTDEYFKAYEINAQVLKSIETPTHILMAEDDPVIPYSDFEGLEEKENIKLYITKHGGHCGFITGWNMRSWVEKHIIENS